MIGMVDKLRNYAERYARDDADRVLASDAADEIERLNREVSRLEDAIAMWRDHSYKVGLRAAGQG